MTLTITSSYRASFISAENIAQHVKSADIVRASEAAADAILSSAEEEAQKIIADAKRKADEILSFGIEALEAEQEILRIRHEKEINALAALDVLNTAQILVARFDALSPWVSQLVVNAVARMVGTIPAHELFLWPLKEYLQQAREGLQLRIRVHPQDYAALNRLRADPKYRILFSAVCEVAEDWKLSPGDCLVEDQEGLRDISIRAQISQLCLELGVEYHGNDRINAGPE